MSDKRLVFGLGLDPTQFQRGLKDAVSEAVRAGKASGIGFRSNFGDPFKNKPVNLPPLKTDEAKKSFDSFLKGIRGSLDSFLGGRFKDILTGVFQGIGQGLVTMIQSAVSTSIGMVKELMSNVMKVGMQAESTRVRFQTMLGDTQGLEAYQVTKRYAASTPFNSEEIAQVGAMLVNVIPDINKMEQALRAAGDVAAGSQQSIKDIGTIVMQVMATGRATNQDMLQLAQRSIPIYQELSKTLGVSVRETQELISQGKISSDVFMEVFQGMSSATGVYFEAAKKQGELAGGLLSTINDSLEAAYTAIYDAITPAVQGFLSSLRDSMNIGEVFTGVMDELSMAAQEFANWLKENPEVIGNMLRLGGEFLSGVMLALIEAAKSFYAWVNENPKVFQALNSLGQAFLVLVNMIGQGYRIWGTLLTQGLTLLTDFLNIVRNIWKATEDVRKEFSSLGGQVLSNIAQSIQMIWDKTTGWLGTLKDAVGWLRQAAEGVGNVMSNAWDMATSNGGSVPSNARVAETASRSVGRSNKDFYHDVRVACAAAVRGILKESGIVMGVTKKAWDGKPGGNPNMARSFFGDDVSQKIGREDLAPGDLVGWRDGGGINHVGVYKGNGRVVSTSSSKGKIQEHGLAFGHYGQATDFARPRAYGTGANRAVSGGSTNVAGAGMLNAAGQQLVSKLTEDGKRNLESLRMIIRDIESEGNYNAVNGASGARGAYQFLPSTRNEVRRNFGVDAHGNQANQDAAFVAYALQRLGDGGIRSLNAGNMNAVSANLRQAWTSLPGGAEESKKLGGRTLAAEVQRRRGTQVASSGGGTSSTPAAASTATTEADAKKLEQEKKKAEQEREKLAKELANQQRAQAENRTKISQEQALASARITLDSAEGLSKLEAQHNYNVLQEQVSLARKLEDLKSQLDANRLTQADYNKFTAQEKELSGGRLQNINRDFLKSKADFNEAEERKRQEEIQKAEEEYKKWQESMAALARQRVHAAERNLEFDIQEADIKARMLGDSVEGLQQRGEVGRLREIQRYQGEVNRINQEQLNNQITQEEAANLRVRAQAITQNNMLQIQAETQRAIAEMQAEKQRATNEILKERLRADAEYRAQIAQRSFDSSITMAQSALSLSTAQTSRLTGDTKVMAQREDARGAIRIDLANQLQQLDEMHRVGTLTAAQLAEARNNLVAISEIKMEDVNREFLTLGETIQQGFVQSLGNALEGLLTGTKTLGEAINDVISSMASMLAQMAVRQLLSSFMPGIPTFSSGGSVRDAMARERGAVSGKPILAVLNEDEIVLNHKQAKKLRESMMIPTFSTGTAPLAPTVGSSSGMSINIPITVNGGLGASETTSQESLKRDLEQVVTAVILKHQRAGGLFR
jgi:tape measure domain-containing protein